MVPRIVLEVVSLQNIVIFSAITATPYNKACSLLEPWSTNLATCTPMTHPMLYVHSYNALHVPSACVHPSNATNAHPSNARPPITHTHPMPHIHTHPSNALMYTHPMPSMHNHSMPPMYTDPMPPIYTLWNMERQTVWNAKLDKIIFLPHRSDHDYRIDPLRSSDRLSS